MKIRRFKREDAEKVSRLIRRALYEVNIRDYPRKIIDRLAESNSPPEIIRKSKRRDIYVAVEGGRIIGTAALVGRGRSHISSTFVNPPYQGMGAGRKLIAHIERVAGRRRIRRLQVPASLTAWQFYKKLGYKKKRSKVTSAGRIIIMEKIL